MSEVRVHPKIDRTGLTASLANDMLYNSEILQLGNGTTQLVQKGCRCLTPTGLVDSFESVD